MPLNQGFKISELELIPTAKDADSPWKNKILLDDAYILSYANSIRGLRYNKLNYQIPLNDIRDDIKGYIGIETLNAPWTDQLFIWHGDWYNAENKNKSYVKVWSPDESYDANYSPSKFNDLDNTYFIIDKAPFPYEIKGDRQNNRGDKGELTPDVDEDGESLNINVPLSEADPAPGAKQLVLKSYVDERLASKRLVEVKDDFYIRDYDCSYLISYGNLIDTAEFPICIHINENVEKRLKHNTLQFNLLIEGKLNDKVSTLDNNSFLAPVSNDRKISLYDSKENSITLSWLSDKPVISNNAYYGRSRYLFITIKLIAHYNEKDEVVYSAYGYCDNMVFSKSNIPECFYVNNQIVLGEGHVNIKTTENNLITITEEQITEGNGGAKIILETKSIIPERENIISVANDNECLRIGLNENLSKLYETRIESKDLIVNKSEKEIFDDEIGLSKKITTYNIESNGIIENNANVKKLLNLNENGYDEESSDKELSSYIINLEEAKTKYNYSLKDNGNNTVCLTFVDNVPSNDTFDFFLYVNAEPVEKDVGNLEYSTITINNLTNGFIWAMSNLYNDSALRLKREQLYCIKFTYIPQSDYNLFDKNTIIGKIDWFYNNHQETNPQKT